VTVGIVGLGFAGLQAAMALEAEGVEVKLFEARHRVGGRCHTVDEGNGAIYEAGGEWIDADHTRILSLLSRFDLEPEPHGSGPRLIRFHNEQTTDEELWSDALEDEIRVESAALELCRPLRHPAWSNERNASLDGRSLRDFILANAQSDRGRWWLTNKLRSDEGDDLDRIGLLGWLCGWLHYADREGDELSAYRFPGGASNIANRMLSTLRAKPNFGCILERVVSDDSGVDLTFDQGTERVDRVILTIPPPALERVVFQPALTVEKRCAIEACRMSRTIKIVWEFDRPWWNDYGWGGSMHTDSPIQQTWSGGRGEAPILTAYICGQEAEDWAKTGDPVRPALFELAKVFPVAAESFRRGWFHDWIADPFAHGGFSYLAPDYVLTHMRHIATPEGRIHFAGEHTANWVGFIEGALESGERVAFEVRNA